MGEEETAASAIEKTKEEQEIERQRKEYLKAMGTKTSDRIRAIADHVEAALLNEDAELLRLLANDTVLCEFALRETASRLGIPPDAVYSEDAMSNPRILPMLVTQSVFAMHQQLEATTRLLRDVLVADASSLPPATLPIVFERIRSLVPDSPPTAPTNAGAIQLLDSILLQLRQQE